LIGTEKLSQRFRNGKGSKKVSERQPFPFLVSYPHSGVIVTAYSTMAVAAGMIAEMKLSALLAIVDFSTKFFAAATDYGPKRFFMMRRHPFTILLQVNIAVLSENILDQRHN